MLFNSNFVHTASLTSHVENTYQGLSYDGSWCWPGEYLNLPWCVNNNIPGKKPSLTKKKGKLVKHKVLFWLDYHKHVMTNHMIILLQIRKASPKQWQDLWACLKISCVCFATKQHVLSSDSLKVESIHLTLSTANSSEEELIVAYLNSAREKVTV